MLAWLRAPLPPTQATAADGFFRLSRAYMAGTPRWVFLLGLPRAAAVYLFLTTRDRIRQRRRAR